MSEENICLQIIEAAEQRFQRYGYKKSSMAEIAKDCDMSAANLYRYFDNKMAICVELAERCLAEKEIFLRNAIQQQDMSASDKLRCFIDKLLEYTYSHLDENPKIVELIEAMSEQRPDIVLKHHNSKQHILEDILREGQQSEEFVVDDITLSAEAISTALMLFGYPAAMELFEFTQLKHKAEQLTHLLLTSLTAQK
jgi:AcrR family transcriptional regulator